MFTFLHPRRGQRELITLYVMSIFSTLHMVIPLYSNSTFLSIFTDEPTISLLYTLGSLITVLAFIGMTHILKRTGNYLLMLVVLIVEFLALIGLATFQDPTLIMSAFVLHLVATTLILFCFDIFLERFTKNSSTGTTRGTYLTFINVAYLIAPSIAGFIVGESDEFWKIYTASFIFLIPVAFFLIRYLRDFKDPHYAHISVVKTLRAIKKKSHLTSVLTASFLLNVFFAWMVIYTPLHLSALGFDFKSMGALFTIMLTAYIFFELPIGRLLDGVTTERTIMMLGFGIMGISTILLTFLSTPSFILWACILFITRIGAAMVEITTESYFFKITDANDSDLLSFFRMTRPLGYIIAPLIASGFLIFFGIKELFIVIGIVTLLGIVIAYHLKKHL